ncbi:hypothetical protein [Nocardia sp. NPDC058480]|uniref:hypothetical protein n=1 Tax=unclassified Nocardia TaxID=2637762 RepID=UPI003659CF89
MAKGVAQLWPYRATVRLHVPADSEQARSAATYATVEPIDAHSCRLEIGADTPRGLTFLLGALDTDFDIEHGPELTDHLRLIAARYTRATAPE